MRELEKLKLGAEGATMENFDGFDQDVEFGKISNFQERIDPIIAAALEHYVKENPCKATGDLKSFYQELAQLKAHNLLARSLIDRGVKTW